MKKKGFTLIEVIIVLTMMLILASFFIPKLTSYQTKAKDTKAVNTARQIYEAALSSYIEQNGKFDSGEVLESINNFTMVSIEENKVSLEDGNQVASVFFISDENEYKVKIFAGSNKYEVYLGTNKIFSNV